MKYKKKLKKLEARRKWFDSLKGAEATANTRPGSQKK
jgi:hypothetical protein